MLRTNPSITAIRETFPMAVPKKVIVIILVIVSLLALTSCGSTKNTVRTIPVETIREVTKVDTIYLNSIRFDSIYASHELLTDRSKDTILIRETNTEYRYKLLRDTIEHINVEVIRDSIPYEVTITQVKEITRPLTWFDHLTRSVFWAVFVIVFVIVFVFVAKPTIRLTRKIRFTL